MDDLWNLKHSSNRPGAQQQLAFAGGQMDVGGSQFSHPFVAQEVCVIERTIRQETVGANLINFGLQGGQKRPDQSNQLLALVSGSQQQSRCSSHSGLVGQVTPHQQHFQLPAGSALSGWPGRSAPHGLYPGNRFVGNGFGMEPDVPSNLIGRESSLLKNNRIALPETLDTALFRRSNMEVFKENVSRAGHENIQWLTELVSQHQRIQSVHGAQVASAPKKTMQQSSAATYNSSNLQVFPASTSGPRVFTLSYSGLSISGELLLTEMGRLEVVCSCHGFHMPVAKFVQHAGSSSVNPGNVVYLENGDNLVQWRKTLFSQFAVKVPDDDVGWDWSDRSGSEMGGNKQRTGTDTLKEADMVDASNSFLAKDRPLQGWDSYIGMATQPAQITSQNGCFSGNLISSNTQDPVPNSFTRPPKGNLAAEVGRHQSSQIQSLQESALKSRKVVGANTLKQTEYATGSTSEFFDFINRGGQAYCSSVEQQLAVREKTVQNDKSWDSAQDHVRQEKDNLASSFELRLGQPSQQVNKAGTSFATTLRSQMQTSGIDQPSSLFYQKTLDTSFQHVQTSGGYGHHTFHWVPGQSNAHQFSQQQRLEKLNVLNVEQFGPSGLERTGFSEMDTENMRAKMWTDSASQATKVGSFNQNADNRVPHEHVGTGVCFIANGQLKAQNPENTLEPLPNPHMKQRITNNRFLDDVVGAEVNPTGLSFPSNVGQQYVSQEYSQATWMQRGSSTLSQKLSTEETGISRHREKEQIVNCFENDNGGLRSSEEIMSWRINNTVGGFVPQHRGLHLQQEVMACVIPQANDAEKERGSTPSIMGCSSTPDECRREELSNAILEKEKSNASPFVITDADADRVNALCSSRQKNALSEPCVQINGNQTFNTNGNNLRDIERGGFLDRQLEHHGNKAAISTVPANSGMLVSVGENELAMPKGHSDKNLSLGNPISQSFGWKAPTVVDGFQTPREDDMLADKSTSVDGEGGTSTNKELPSDVCSKSSGNVLSGFSDARHTNEETSTLECESKRRTSHDVVDEGSGIGKCSSDEHLSADKKLESTVSGHKWQESPSSLRRGVSSSEANDSVIMETLQGTRDTMQGSPACKSGVMKVGRKRKKMMKWKRLNAGFTAMSTKNSDAPKGNDSGLTESLAVQERVSDENKKVKGSSLVSLQTPKQKRSRTFGMSRSLALSDKIEDPKENSDILKEKKKLTLLKIRGPQLRDRPRRGREAMMTQSGKTEEQAVGSDKPEGIDSGIRDGHVDDQRKASFLKRKRPPIMGNGKMMSLKSILKMPDDASERKTSVTEISEEKLNPKALKTSKNVKLKNDEGISSPKEIRKRKLSELSNTEGPPAASAPHRQVEARVQPVTAEKRPFRVGPSVVPRGERSPRQVPKKANKVWLNSKALHLSGTEEPSKHTHVSSLERNSNPSHNGSSKVLATCDLHPVTDRENRFVPKRKRFGASSKVFVSEEESRLNSRKVAAIDTKFSKRRKVTETEALNLGATGPPTLDSEPASQTQKPKKEKERKGQAIEDDDLSVKQCRRSQIQKAGDCKSQDSCSVCGSSHSEASNQLIYCSCCPVKVHQACYGVPKVPKSSWTCRACKSNVSNIVCVLCGYGGGAMTRAQKARAVVKGLLKAWDAVGFNDRRVKASVKRTFGLHLRRSMRGSAKESMSSEAESGRSRLVLENGSSEGKAVAGDCGSHGDTGPMGNTVMAAVRDPSVPQWVHMVCALWMPGTRCLNLGTMGIFDVSGVALARRRLTCSICKRQGGSCIQCLEPKCAIPFHPWCAHTKGLLQIETVNGTGGRVRFHGRCIDHWKASFGEENAVTDGTVKQRLSIGSSASKCARTEGYHGKPTLEQRATQKKALGSASVSQQEVGTWIRVNERKTSGRRFFKPPNSDLKTDHREYLRFKQEQRWRRLAVYKSAIHALGLYTTQNILKGEMVVEYIGEIVGLRVADKREAEYCRRMQYQGACYLFRIDEESIIDATRKGGIARFVNHSCSPNCVAKIIEVKNRKKVVFFAQIDIKAGEELTYNYHFSKETEDAKIPCLCGAQCCGKKLN